MAMAWGTVDDAEFQRFVENVNAKIETQELKKQIERSTKRVGKQAMETVKTYTPEDTGHLRRTWHVRGPFMAGTTISMELYNNAVYAPYVESGHRTRTPHTKESIKRSKGVHWIPGAHMLIKTLFELENQMPELLTPELQEFLQGLF